MLCSIHRVSTILLAAIIAGGASMVARAGPGGSVSLISDYVLRGVSQSNGQSALQGDAHWNFPVGWSAGAWASQVRFAPGGATAEYAIYLQWQRAISADFDLGTAVTHYSYPNDPRPIAYDYDEASLSLAWRDQIYVAATWTPRLNLYSFADGLASNRHVFSIETSWHRTLARRIDLTAGFGFYDPQNLDYASYGYGNVTLGWHYGHWRTNLSAIWVQDAAHRQYSPGPAGGPLAATVTWVF